MGSIMSIEIEKTAQDLINEKKNQIGEFLNNISNKMPEIGLSPEYYERSVNLLDTEYKYGVNHVIAIDGYYEKLKP
jgi:hypothetical protein